MEERFTFQRCQAFFCSELVVGIASMGALHDLDAFDGGQIQRNIYELVSHSSGVHKRTLNMSRLKRPLVGVEVRRWGASSGARHLTMVHGGPSLKALVQLNRATC
ncbi:hypothetical protein TNCV_2410141 [Trichonephila clavipes]|nr:hypothetical protein TNCV_2410141 [Trichonephila clavipes]